ncbi:OLC1v1001352C1 [Oldenlandia corymbosa var. corymbosa]|uniref:OLC1v1001352C1 n=1 Tax=Oldenlandia corymbosa var. corymbosa TaxID=529605 RepID=A0AAV1D5B9_OLDCO|nr:OLC1v1001352C1 [Oldenlandia corymbosa var. corymbosa]
MTISSVLDTHRKRVSDTLSESNKVVSRGIDRINQILCDLIRSIMMRLDSSSFARCKSVSPIWKKMFSDRVLQLSVREFHAQNNDEVVIFGCKYIKGVHQPHPITFVDVNLFNGNVFGFSTDEVLTVDEYGVNSMLPITTDLICLKTKYTIKLLNPTSGQWTNQMIGKIFSWSVDQVLTPSTQNWNFVNKRCPTIVDGDWLRCPNSSNKQIELLDLKGKICVCNPEYVRYSKMFELWSCNQDDRGNWYWKSEYNIKIHLDIGLSSAPFSEPYFHTWGRPLFLCPKSSDRGEFLVTSTRRSE